MVADDEEDSYTKKLRDGLAKIHGQAPSEIATVLGSWDPNKAGNDIVAYWAEGRRFPAPLLRAALGH